MFNVNENLRNLSQETRDKIKEDYLNTFGKMMPNSKSLNNLVQLFIQNVEPNFIISCSKCKRRVIAYWGQRLKSWEML